MKVLTCLIMLACNNASLTMWTGHVDQASLINPAFQHSMDKTQNGAVTYWNDPTTKKSGYIKPLYASKKYAGHCRHFEIAYFYPDKEGTYHYGIACRNKDSFWQVK
jgi:surface antigen